MPTARWRVIGSDRRATWRPILAPDAGAASDVDRLPSMEPTVATPTDVVAVVADDLIWSSRLRAAVERAGGRALAMKPQGVPDVSAALVIVDLTGRSYDGVAQVAAASATGAIVIAVGQHDDVELRKRALAAGARRVYSYNKLFSDGPSVIGDWLARARATGQP
jgi:hypothetical protein